MLRLRQVFGIIGQWVGTVGTCLTLFTSIEPLIILSNWAKLIVEAWKFYTHAFWQQIFGWFFLFEIDPTIFPMLSASVFMLLIGLSSTRAYRNLIDGNHRTDVYINDFVPPPRVDFWITLLVIGCFQSAVLFDVYVELITHINKGESVDFSKFNIGAIIVLIGVLMLCNSVIADFLSGDNCFFSRKERFIWWGLCIFVPGLILFFPESGEFTFSKLANISMRLYGMESLFITPAIALLISDNRILLSRFLSAGIGLVILIALNYVSNFENEIRSVF